jgi:type I restriction enzyme, S subunit
MSAMLEAREPSARYLVDLQPAVVRQFEVLATAPNGVGRLRAFILTLAVQGKLVPGHARDAGKAQSRHTPVADPPFQIPETWQWTLLGEVVDVVRGIAFPASEKTREAAPGRVACLRTANVQESIEWEDLLFVNRSFVGREDQILRRHDVVMSMANSRELVGKVALVESIPHVEATFGGFLGVLRSQVVEPLYLMIVLRTAYARARLIDSASQTTNIANVSLGKLRPLPFPLPPSAEQARIVARVDELMRLCDALEAKGRLEAEQHARLLSTLLGTLTDSRSPEELAANWQRVAAHFDLLLDRPEAVDALERTVVQLGIRGLLVSQSQRDEPATALVERARSEKERLISDGALRKEKPLAPIADDEKPFDLPSGWTWVRWNEIALQIGDIDHKMPQEVANGVPYISPRDFHGANEIDFDGAKKISRGDYKVLAAKIRPTRGDLIYPRYGTIGNVRLVTDDRAFLASYSCAVVKVMHGFIDPYFQYLLSCSEDVRLQAVAATNTTTQPNVGLKSIQAYVLPLPPLAEQTRIVVRVTQLRHLCADLRERLAASRATQARLADTLIETAVGLGG